MNAPARHLVAETPNAARADAGEISLSILIPFYKDDPTPLAAALNAQIGARRDIEILLYDDGRPDPALNAAVARCVRALSAPAVLLTGEVNRGRSAGRNTLAAAARGSWLLYLDADMRPAGESFLAGWLEIADEISADAVFGGFESEAPKDPDQALHAAVTRRSDEHGAEMRERIGPTAFCGSNLLVRAEAMRACPFDESFAGWGYEDTEWAVRAAKRYSLTHADNPARHGGLSATDGLLAKYRAGANNYARLLALHPELADLPLARTARALQFLPLRTVLKRLSGELARSRFAPMRLRIAALKFWRAFWCAEVME